MKTFRFHRGAWLPLLFLLLLRAAPAAAQADPSIRDWGSPPGTPPPWQTPDVWVDDGDGVVNEPGEPSRGKSNRLFARIRNLGSSPASQVRVRFAFAPYGLWSPGSHADFKQIAEIVKVPSLDAGEEKTVEVEWDLTQLTEDNGGAWGGHTVADFDHFCVLVTVAAENDANPSNNLAQNNFGAVTLAAGATSAVRFLIANPKPQEAVAEILVRGLPADWRFQLDGAVAGRNVLRAREVRLVTLAFTPPAGNPEATAPLHARADVSLRLDGQVLGGISFDAAEPAAAAPFPPAGGVLGPYLIGTYDLRPGHRTTFQVLNPTGRPLQLLAAFFDADGQPAGCLRDRLGPNDLLEIDARRHVNAHFGVVKIVALEGAGRPAAGVAGNQRTFTRRLFSGFRLGAESALHAIPAEVLAGDMDKIRRACP